MPPGMWKIFNHGQIHGLVHIIIIFSPHPHKVRDAVRDLRRFFCFHLSSSLFYSYTKLHHFFLIPGMERAVFSTLFRKRWQKHRAAFLFSKARPRKISGCKASLLCMHEIVGIRLTLPYYESAYNLDMRKVIDVYATAQQHIDQGMALTLFMRSTIPAGLYEWKNGRTDKMTTRDLNILRMYAYHKGVKSIYYVRTYTDDMEEFGVNECESCSI